MGMQQLDMIASRGRHRTHRISRNFWQTTEEPLYSTMNYCFKGGIAKAHLKALPWDFRGSLLQMRKGVVHYDAKHPPSPSATEDRHWSKMAEKREK